MITYREILLFFHLNSQLHREINRNHTSVIVSLFIDWKFKNKTMNILFEEQIPAMIFPPGSNPEIPPVYEPPTPVSPPDPYVPPATQPETPPMREPITPQVPDPYVPQTPDPEPQTPPAPSPPTR